MSGDQNNMVQLDGQRLIAGLLTSNGYMITARSLGFATVGVAFFVLLQTFILEPSLWWFRAQATLLFIFASGTTWALMKGQRTLSDSVEEAREDL